MDFGFMSGINALGGGVLGYLIPFLFVLTVVVFFHELGHFLVARWCGVRVLVFSIGFVLSSLASTIVTTPDGSCALFHSEDM
jgi:hypothetical protein